MEDILDTSSPLAKEMKIGISATFLNESPTGVGVFTKEVSERLCAFRRDTVVYTSVTLNGSIKRTPVSLKGSVRFANNLKRFLYTNLLLPFKLKKSKIDVLYCPIMEFPFAPVVPQVTTVHDLHPVYFPEQFGYAASHFKVSLRLLPFMARRIVVPSRFVKKELLKAVRLDAEAVDVVYAGYNSSLFMPRGEEMRKEFLERYPIRTPYILFVGSLFPYKNVKVLLKSFINVKSRIPHSLIIVGKKEVSREPLLEDERILYLDYVSADQLPFFYSYADLLVHPSLCEGFGITILEAMACGTPVISSRGGSLPEVIGDAGILFDPLDSETLGRMILDVITNKGLRNQMRGKGFRQIEQFSWDKTAESIIRSCERAVEGKG
jgi:glycosyltransferase involved in cell wall biosynthesis